MHHQNHKLFSMDLPANLNNALRFNNHRFIYYLTHLNYVFITSYHLHQRLTQYHGIVTILTEPDQSRSVSFTSIFTSYNFHPAHL